MTASKPANRGRPKTRIVDRLRGSFWSHSVLLESGLTEVQELEAVFGKTPGLKLASGLWSRYMRGEVLPQGTLLPAARNTLVHRVAKFFPRTSDTFYAPFWDFLEWDSIVNFDLVKSTYLKLNEDIHVQFVARIEVDGERVPTANGKFWYLPKSVEARRRVVAALGDWDSLTVCLLEARMSYAAQNFESFADSQLLACKTIARLQKVQKLQAKRLQGVLLTMEALCLDALVINVVKPTPLNQTQYQTRERCRDWMKNWNRRCNAHAESLSSKSRLAFVRTLQVDTLIGRSFDGH